MLTLPPSLIDYVRQHFPEDDECGMTLKLADAFDDLHLGVTIRTLADIAILAMLFIKVKGHPLEETMKARLDEMEAQLIKDHFVLSLGPVNAARIAIEQRTIVLEKKHAVGSILPPDPEIEKAVLAEPE